jgi:N-carbamoylputrescine amidase
MSPSTLRVALVTEVFFDDSAGERLLDRLVGARDAGAELVVLPELPLDPWVPISKRARPEDAEEPEGPRHRLQADAARRAGVALLGGAIVRDPATGKRHNTALLFDRNGVLSGSYRKVHLPFEEDFWEAAHYRPGDKAPEVMPGLPLPVGVQICSDANRTTGCQLLAARGAEVIIVPRATPASSWERWRLVLRADAVTSAAWVVTVNRPANVETTPVGGPSAVIAPDGTVVAENTEPMTVVRLDRESVERARNDYPGYLDFHPEVYERAWRTVAARSSGGRSDLTPE